MKIVLRLEDPSPDDIEPYYRTHKDSDKFHLRSEAIRIGHPAKFARSALDRIAKLREALSLDDVRC